MNRREFLQASAAAALVSSRVSAFAQAENNAAGPRFSTANQRWQKAYDKALEILAKNVQVMPRYDKPILIEGSQYAGIWQECGPHESYVYRKFRPDVARNSHMTFFALQRPDGQLPANNKQTEAGFGQIQMVVPIAATAWDLAEATGDEELLRTAYESCSRWDAWLLRFRNTRGTGLTEGFCTYDTGHDNSPRWNGIPPQCPDKDAKKFPPIPTLPRLCPDLSATVYGMRVALGEMARALGRWADVERWEQSAEHIRQLILTKLYAPEDAAFYDLDAQNNFVRVRGDILTRICGEHVVDQKTFDDLWTRQLHHPKAFWAAYPLPSIALDDPSFVRPIPRNSWGGASQALTALRAGRWFDYYHRSAELGHLMEQWCEAIQRDMTFRQQLDPLTGEFTKEDLPDYSPCALVMMDFTWRLAGIEETLESVFWNVRPGVAAAEGARFEMQTDSHVSMEMRYGKTGAELYSSGRLIATVQGGAVRVVTDKAGGTLSLMGIHTETQHVTVRLAGQAAKKFTVQANQKIAL